MPRRSASRAVVADHAQLACDLINRECGNGVVATIRAVEKIATWVHLHLGRKVGACEAVRQSGDGLCLRQIPTLLVITERRERRRQLVDDVGEASPGWSAKCRGPDPGVSAVMIELLTERRASAASNR